MLDIDSFSQTYSDLNNLRVILAAYMDAGTAVQDRYKVDLQRMEYAANAGRDCPKRIAAAVDQDDYITAYVIAGHTQMLVAEADFALTPFKDEIYRKSHPAK